MEMTIQQLLSAAAQRPCRHIRRAQNEGTQQIRCDAARTCPEQSHVGQVWEIEGALSISTIETMDDRCDPEDKNWWKRTDLKWHGTLPALLCSFCAAHRPSALRIAKEQVALATKRAAASRNTADELLERYDDGDALYLCSECDTIIGEEELVPVRYCPLCEATFDATDGRNCTECNRPFTRRVVDAGCVDCLAEDDQPALVTDRSTVVSNIA